MTQRSMFWDLSGGGDAEVYDQSHLMDRFFRALLNGTGDRGVLKGWRDNLEVTGTTSPLSVAAGGAIIYGMFYDTDSGIQVGIPTPDSGTATYLVVVRRSWGGQTCRVNRVTALTQTVDVTWDVPLASVEVNSAGECTVTDTRDWARFSTDWRTNIVRSHHYEDGAVTPTKIMARTRWQTSGAGEIEEHTEGIYEQAVWTGSGGFYGSAYDYWQMPDWATSSIWAYFRVPNLNTAEVDLHLWNVPDVNAGAGAQNVHWDYYVYWTGVNYEFAEIESGAVLVDQDSRLEANIYRDTLATGIVAYTGTLLAVRLDRAALQADDTFGSPIRTLALELSYEAVS